MSASIVKLYLYFTFYLIGNQILPETLPSQLLPVQWTQVRSAKSNQYKSMYKCEVYNVTYVIIYHILYIISIVTIIVYIIVIYDIRNYCLNYITLTCIYKYANVFTFL